LGWFVFAKSIPLSTTGVIKAVMQISATLDTIAIGVVILIILSLT